MTNAALKRYNKSQAIKIIDKYKYYNTYLPSLIIVGTQRISGVFEVKGAKKNNCTHMILISWLRVSKLNAHQQLMPPPQISLYQHVPPKQNKMCVYTKVNHTFKAAQSFAPSPHLKISNILVKPKTKAYIATV